MTVNAELLTKTLKAIRHEVEREDWANPDEALWAGKWDQRIYRCGTGMCFAGWAVTLDGGQWADAEDTNLGKAFLVAAAGDDEQMLLGSSVPVVHVAKRAARILGITDKDADTLFSGGNTLALLEEQVAYLIEHNTFEGWDE